MTLDDYQEIFVAAQSNFQDLNNTQRGRWLLASMYDVKIAALLEAGDLQKATDEYAWLLEKVDGGNMDQIPALLLKLYHISMLVGDQASSEKIRQTLNDRGYSGAIEALEIPDQNLH